MTAVAEAPGQIERMPQTLYERILDAAKAVGVVEKSERNQFHNYDYASIEGIVDAVHDELIERGILWLGGTGDWTDRQRPTRDGEATVTTVEMLFTFIDVHSGERLELPWMGRGDDPAGQGLAKALTDARKTFIVQQLNLRRGDDPEKDAKPDQPDQARANADTVNLTGLINGSGISNADLNAILVAANLPAHEKPYGSFARIPADVAENVQRNLEAARAHAAKRQA